MAGELALSASALRLRYLSVRQATNGLVEPLSPEDCQVQSMEDASPVKWHLAHTTWFFETLVLSEFDPSFRAFDPSFAFLFNSYYESLGPRHERPKRGLITRPSLAQVFEYRAAIDARMVRLLDSGNLSTEALERVRLGLEHEQQHQELLLTDVKHALFQNPIRPRYRASRLEPSPPARGGFESFGERVATIGAQSSPGGFAFDNEGPRHRALVLPFELATAPVTNGQYRDFVRAGGYRDARLWLSDGWALVQSEGWAHPLYWLPEGQSDEGEGQGEFDEFTLAGVGPLDVAAPVCHLSYFEAEAYAAWAEARLPTEFEWEIAARSALGGSNGRGAWDGWGPAQETGRFHPGGTTDGVPGSWLGGVWEWTRSGYAAYPGYRAPAGPLGEYNGKFMCGQLVLRGGSCVTPREHARVTYRNFFPPRARWQFSGLRLAR